MSNAVDIHLAINATCKKCLKKGHFQHMCSCKSLIGASLSEPHHMRSTVKSVFMLVCVYVCLAHSNPLCG